VRDFFYSYGKATQQEKDNLFNLTKLSGFKASTNDQLIPIRQLELFKTRNKLESDESLAAADKQSKLADIDKQLAALTQAK
jgi:phosphonate transport system substrate-binding protein